MITSLILGTGLPTIPTYIITASLAAPALLKLGVPLIVSHMFVFYYGIIADLTPPVALAALAAAPIAKASPDAIGWQATRMALAGFLIPFMAVYEPALMLQGDGGAVAAQFGYWVEVAWVCSRRSWSSPCPASRRSASGLRARACSSACWRASQRRLSWAAFPGAMRSGLALAAAVTLVNWSRSRKRAAPRRSRPDAVPCGGSCGPGPERR